MKLFLSLILILITQIISAQTTPGEYTIKNLDVNTKFSDFGATFFGRDTIVFASPKKGTINRRLVWNGNNQPFLDLFIGNISEKDEILNKRKMMGDVNGKYHEGVVSFTKDMKTMYFSANNYAGKKIRNKKTKNTNNIQLFKAVRDSNDRWIKVESLPFNNAAFSSGHPALNKDDTKLYFISDRPGSIGKTDIYVVDINEDGSYGEPKNLGPKINTNAREMFPFVSEENILYFSSDGHSTYGKLDVFASKIFDNTVSSSINLGNPINSDQDDFAYIINDNKHKGFFSSNREGGKGDDDIYAFSSSPPINIECFQTVSGVVRDKNTGGFLPGALVVLLDDRGNELQKTLAKETDAFFSFEVPCNTSFKLVTTLEKYLMEDLNLKTVNDLDSQPIELKVDLTPELEIVDTKAIINLNPIYFDFDQYSIRQEAKAELNKIVLIMKEFPNLTIKVNSHTDSRGTNLYNMNLSNLRAKATVDYLLSQGVKPNRISGKGYGELHLVENCINDRNCNELQHQLNRRSEFVIVQNVKGSNVINVNNKPVLINSVGDKETNNIDKSLDYSFSSDNDRSVYTVQIGAFKKNDVQLNIFRNITTLLNHHYDDGFNRYFSGVFKTKSKALQHVKQLRKMGYKDSFVVRLKGSIRFFK